MTGIPRPRATLRAHLMVNGECLPAASGEVFEHVDPSTGQVQATVPSAGDVDVDLAVTGAYAALASWRRWNSADRRRALNRLANLMSRNLEELAAIQSLEVGLAARFAPWLVTVAAEQVEDAAGWADKLYGSTLPIGTDHRFNFTTPEPVGVVGIIETWNGSVPNFAMDVAPAIAVGCTVVIKTSEFAPFGPVKCAELCLEAGIPPGVVNVVSGGVTAAAALVAHPLVSKVLFTGSPEAGRQVAVSCAQNLKPCILELGGKSARIVFADANLQEAVNTTLNMAVMAGQQCTLGSRILVEEVIAVEFSALLVDALEHVRVGDPFDPETSMGPVVSASGCDRILGLVNRARDYATVRTGGQRLGGALSNGFFISPTLIDQVKNDSEVATTEIFGPVLSMTSFRDEEEAVALANDSKYGLAAYVSTRDVSRAHRVAALLDAGNVGVNSGFAPASPAMPFGGRKRSGYGKQGGLAGIMEFVSLKTVQIGID